MARIDHDDALDDWLRGELRARGRPLHLLFLGRPEFAICAASAQGTNDNIDNDDDIDRDEILCGAHCRPHRAQVRQAEQEAEVREGGGKSRGGG